MTGWQSKKMLRHADDVTLNHLIELRKLEAENELLRIENERLRLILEQNNVQHVLEKPEISND